LQTLGGWFLPYSSVAEESQSFAASDLPLPVEKSSSPLRSPSPSDPEDSKRLPLLPVYRGPSVCTTACCGERSVPVPGGWEEVPAGLDFADTLPEAAFGLAALTGSGFGLAALTGTGFGSETLAETGGELAALVEIGFASAAFAGVADLGRDELVAGFANSSSSLSSSNNDIGFFFGREAAATGLQINLAVAGSAATGAAAAGLAAAGFAAVDVAATGSFADTVGAVLRATADAEIRLGCNTGEASGLDSGESAA